MSAALAFLLVLCGTQDAGIDKLTVQVRVEKSSYMDLEPVHLLVTVENRSGHPIPGLASPFSADVEVQVAAPNKDFAPYHPPSRPACSLSVEPTPASIPVKYTGKECLSVYYKTICKDKTQDRVFPETGTYRCRVRFSFGDKQVTSDPVDVVITKPALPVDQAAADYLKEHDLDLFLDGEAKDFAVTDAMLSKAEELLKIFPKSSYEPYLCTGIGAVYFGRSTPGNSTGKLFDEEGLKKSVTWCQPAANLGNHPSTPQAAFLAGKACYFLKNARKARTFLTQAVACGWENYSSEGTHLLESVKTLEAAGINKDD